MKYSKSDRTADLNDRKAIENSGFSGASVMGVLIVVGFFVGMAFHYGII